MINLETFELATATQYDHMGIYQWCSNCEIGCSGTEKRCFCCGRFLTRTMPSWWRMRFTPDQERR